MENKVVKTIEEINAEILKSRMDKYNEVEGPRVGDFLILPNGDYDRFTHHWGESIQTGGSAGRFYLGTGYIGYSGGLDPGVKIMDIEQVNEMHEGSIWFFSNNRAKAHNGVYFKVPFRVFKFKEGADTSGVRIIVNKTFYNEMGTTDQCGDLVLIEVDHTKKPTTDYNFLVYKGTSNHTAFYTREGLMKWLSERGLELTTNQAWGNNSFRIKGIYKATSTMNVEWFNNLLGDTRNEKIKVLCNGQYTQGIAIPGEIKEIVSLNPNCKERVIYPYHRP